MQNFLNAWLWVLISMGKHQKLLNYSTLLKLNSVHTTRTNFIKREQYTLRQQKTDLS